MSGAVALAQYGFTAEEIVPSLQRLADISSGDAMKMEGLTRAFAQVRAAGRLMGQEVLQFTNSGFNPLQEMAKALAKQFGGLANNYMPFLKKKMEEGKITYQDVADTLISATSEGGTFFEQSKKQSEELTAKFNALVDSIKQVAEAFGQILAPTAGGVMGKLTYILQNMAASTKTWGEMFALVSQSAERKTWTEIWRDLESRLIEIEAATLKIDFGPISEKNGKLFENVKNLYAMQSLEQGKEGAEKSQKEMEKLQKRLDGLKKAQELEAEILKIGMSDFERKRLDARVRMQEIRKELMEKLKIDIEYEKARTRSATVSAEFMKKVIDETKAELDRVAIQAERLPFMDRFEEIRKASTDDFFKKNPQAKIMYEANQIAQMIRLGMLTMQHGSAELARVMQENTNATQQQSYDLPRTLQAGTVEAYQAMFGRDNTAKLQLAEQKRQVAEQQKANGLLNDLLNKNPIKAMN
jgi:tape measure domain-containing protein